MRVGSWGETRLRVAQFLANLWQGPVRSAVAMGRLAPPRTSPNPTSHAADVRTQDQYRVNSHKSWVDEPAGMLYSLDDAPPAHTAVPLTREAHGLVADHIYQVEEGS